MLQCIRRYYKAIKVLPSKEAESIRLYSLRGINITRTRRNVTYNVPCRLVLNWPAVELVTFVHCIYQHRRSRDWSVFLSPDGVTLVGMSHRRNYTIRFVHIITGSMLPTLRIVAVQHKYLWWLCQSDVYSNMLLIGTDCLQLYVYGKTHLPSSVLWKYGTRNWTKVGRHLWGILPHRRVDQFLELLLPFVLLLRHGYCGLKNIKSIRGLVMFKGNKWNHRSCLISKLGYRNLCKERNFSVAEEWTKL
jgi:hypothetical protein